MIKKIVLAVISVVISASVFGCSAINPAKKAVDDMFTAFEELDFDTAREYIDLDEIQFSENDGSVAGNAEMYMQNLFDRLSHEIISAERADENTMTVKTKITAVDMEPVMVNFFTNAMHYTLSSAVSEEKPTDEEMDSKLIKLFTESAKDTSIPTVTNEVDITVTNINGTWKVQNDEAFIDALFGNITKALENIESALNETE